MSNKRKSLHQKAAIYLQEVLNCTAPGERLPALAELCKSSSVKRTIMCRELEKLQASGDIIIRRRQGIYKTALPGKTPEVWVLEEVGLSSHTAGFVYDLFTTLQTLAAADGVKLRCLKLDLDTLLEFPLLAARERISDLLLWGSTHDWFRQVCGRCCRNIVEVLPRHTVNGSRAVIDSPEMSRIQLDYLFKLGYRNIGYIHNATPPRESCVIQYDRLNDYYRIMAEHALPVYPEWVFCGYCTPEKFRNRFLKMVSGAHPVNAVICSGCFLSRLCQTARDQLLLPGEDIAIMGCDEIQDLPEPEFTTVTNSPSEIARTAWKLLAEARNNQPPRTVRSALSIIAGQTVKRLHRSMEQ